MSSNAIIITTDTSNPTRDMATASHDVTPDSALAVSPVHLSYILSLPDTHKTYTRFFDALLITRPSHRAFFHDLRSFRNQEAIISLLLTCDANDESLCKDDLRRKYREVTKCYLASRFAHPWCRKVLSVSNIHNQTFFSVPGSTKAATAISDSTATATKGVGQKAAKGWWSAEWGSTGRKISKQEAEEEEKLHKLLVPIWIVMKGRMFPGDGVVGKWWKVKQEDEERIRRVREMDKENYQLDTDVVGRWLDTLAVKGETNDVITIGIEEFDAMRRGEADEISPISSLSSISTSQSANSRLDEDHYQSTQQSLGHSISPLSPSSTSLPSLSPSTTTTKKPQAVSLQPPSQSNLKTKASSIPIILEPIKSHPNLRQSFWDSEEARQLERDLRRRDRERQLSHASNGSDSSNSKKDKKFSFGGGRHRQQQQPRRQERNKYYVPGYDSPDDFDDEDDANDSDKDNVNTKKEINRRGQAHGTTAAATSVFRIAAAGMLLSTVPKWKTKRLMKKLGESGSS